MNVKVKERWIAALESGKFKQGKQQLRSGDTYCCLGVLCEVYKEDHPNFIYDEANANPDEPVSEWAGLNLTSDSPLYVKFWDLNDLYNKTFPEIANYIRENF